MDRRAFGRTGLIVSMLGMGCGRLGSDVSREADRHAKAAVERALELGITFFDIADVYGRGRAETILGRAIRRSRADVVIATKCGLLRTPATVFNALSSSPARTAVGFLKERRGHREYSPAYIERAVEASLRRLGRDGVEVLLLHSPPRSVLKDEGFMEAFWRLKAAGKVRACGVSVRGGADGIGDTLAALQISGLDCLELELNICANDAVATALPAASERGLAVIARQPFASGALLRDGSGRSPGVVAACLQFALGAPGVSVVIPGMTRPEHVTANIEGAAAPLPEGALNELRAALC
jgi:aryl-alcohol dehydrogenase-like predicted oxidoreductase